MCNQLATETKYESLLWHFLSETNQPLDGKGINYIGALVEEKETFPYPQDSFGWSNQIDMNQIIK